MTRLNSPSARSVAAVIALLPFTTLPALAHTLPLGDGKYGSSAKTGYVFSCQTRFGSNQGAFRSGDWLDAKNKTWDPDKKPLVDGAVDWPSRISISLEGGKRIVRANGLPDHPTGTYPVSRSDDAYNFDRNPNSIREMDVLLSLAANPAKAGSPSCVPMGMIGFMISGAKLFNALDAMGQDAPAHEIQDLCNGHPERSGEYHYHNLPPCIADKQSGPGGHSDLMGYALDGFGIFGPHESASKVLHTKDLDACHGHVSKVMWDGKAVEMYHYHFTEDYPHTISCFSGSPVSVPRGRP